MKRKFAVIFLAVAMLVSMVAAASVTDETVTYKMDFNSGKIDSENWKLERTTLLQNSKLYFSTTDGTTVNGWGLLNSTNAFGKVTWQTDIELLEVRPGSLNLAWVGLRLPRNDSYWGEGIWFGIGKEGQMRVKISEFDDTVGSDPFPVPIKTPEKCTLKIVDELNGKIYVYSHESDGSDVLLCTADTKSADCVKVYDYKGELKYTSKRAINPKGGYLGIMCHFHVVAADNLEATGTVITHKELENGMPRTYFASKQATVGSTPVNEIFNDVDHVEWAWEGIAALNARGVVAGTSATTFEPDGVLTREQFLKMVAGAFDLADAEAKTSFADVQKDAWYYSYVAGAEKAGLLEGIYSGTLGVGQPISRQDIVVIASRALATKGIELREVRGVSDFEDMKDIAFYAREPVQKLCKAGIISGMTETTFEPEASCTRAMAAKVLCGLLNYYPRHDFRDTMPDTWVGVDELGREMLTYKDTREYRTDKAVGMFYYVWHDINLTSQNHEILDSALEFAKSPSERNWTTGKMYYSQEPYFGYYSPYDEFVIRKNLQMLADMGVDFIYVDGTNYRVFQQETTDIMKVMREMMNEGIKVPKISWIVNSNQTGCVNLLYRDVYSCGAYPETWFYWEGKPLVLADPPMIEEQIRDFFTARYSWAYSQTGGWNRDTWWNDGEDRWPWLAQYPQPYGWHGDPTIPEQLVISTAEHANSNRGKSFTTKEGTPSPLRTNEGLFFAEQISRLDEIDPKVLMISQWNEKIAGLQKYPMTSTLGNEQDSNGWCFIDCLAEEWCRDIEPVKDSYGDNYYYQSVNAVRKFRGVRPYPSTDKKHTISIGSDFGAWNSVEEIYYDDVYDIPHRDHLAIDRKTKYIDESGRNDFIESRAARDDENLYFYVKTRDNMTFAKKNDKMHTVLLLNTDGDYTTGWYGYDYVIGRARINGVLSVEKNLNNSFEWEVVATAPYVTKGNEKHLSVSKEAIGIEGNTFTVDFKWADNQPESLQIMDFIDKGDAAPNGRFNYRFEAK